MKNVFKRISSAIGTGARAFVALVGVAGITAAVANYAMTQGSGTNFGSIVVSTVHYAQMLVCDQTTPAQCGGVTASNEQKVLDSQVLAAVQAAIPAGTNLIGKVGIDQTTDGTTNGIRITNAYPTGATPITASATGTTAATTATLAGTSGKTTYICGYSIRANATATTTVTNTVTGVITATLSSIMWVPANTAGLGVDEQIFSPCIPASGTNTAIAAVSGAPGTGGVVSSKAWGYQQ